MASGRTASSSSEKPSKLKEKEKVPADSNIPDNYVSWTLKNQKELPPITWNNWWKELNYISCAVLTVTPAIAIWGLFNVSLQWKTFAWSIVYYYITGLGESSLSVLLELVGRTGGANGKDRRPTQREVVQLGGNRRRGRLYQKITTRHRYSLARSIWCLAFSLDHELISRILGITAGYHRLWAHRSYNASKPLQYLLAMAGAGAVEGSIKWWSRGHRAHHRYTDTDLDPYNAHKGLWWSHVGWMLVKPRRKPGVADVSDLSKNEVVRWQHRWYLYLIIFFGFVFPMLVAGFGWGDFLGGFVYAGAGRLCFVHHVRLSPI